MLNVRLGNDGDGLRTTCQRAESALGRRKRVDNLAGLGVVKFSRASRSMAWGSDLSSRSARAGALLLLKTVDLLAQLLVFKRFCCQTDRPCLPLTTCKVSRSASATASTLPAGRTARGRASTIRRKRSAALVSVCSSRFSVLGDSCLHVPGNLPYPITNFLAAALKRSMSFSSRASV